MSIIGQLATSLNRRDEVPNQVLAKNIAAKNNTIAIKELVELLSGKNKDIQNDCIKVLYEIGEQKPALIEPYTKTFVSLLDHKNNRLQWGAMIALGQIAVQNPKTIHPYLTKILDAAGKGSVITKDHAVNILIALCAVKQYSDKLFALLNEQLLKSATNQLAMYAERSAPAINEKNKNTFVKTLVSRLDDLEKESQRKRIEKVIKKFS